MSKKKGGSRIRTLIRARRLLGMPMFPKEDVFRVAAKRLERPCPTNKNDGYALLSEFVAQHAPVIQPVAAKTVKAMKALPVVAQAPSQRQQRKVAQAASDEFLASYEWRRLRMEVIKKRGARCECCGASPKDGIRINVDHVKPRKLFPALALDESNLQVLCEACNHGKGNWDQTDWRIVPVTDRIQ